MFCYRISTYSLSLSIFRNVSGSAVSERGVFIILPAVLHVLTLKEKNAKNSENGGLLALC